MADRLMDGMEFHGRALELRARRQQALSSNIANADTPDYKARDMDFARSLRDATGMRSGQGATPPARADRLQTSSARHLPGAAGAGAGAAGGSDLAYRRPEQGSVDGNTVDLNRERSAFADNAIRYEATLRFINARIRSMTSAIKGE